MKYWLYSIIFIATSIFYGPLNAENSSIVEPLNRRTATPVEHIFDTLVKFEKQANEFGLCWENIDQPLNDVKIKVDKVAQAFKNGDKEALKRELGELIIDAFSVAIFCGYEPADLIKTKMDRFPKKFEIFKSLVKAQGLENLKGKPFNVALDYWQKADQAMEVRP